MRQKVLSSLMVGIMLTTVFSQSIYAGFKLPDVGGLASDLTSGISDKAQQAGEALSGAAGQAGGLLSGLASGVGSAASGAAGQIGDIATGFASHAGSVVSIWGQQAGKTADGIKEKLSDAGVTVKVTAEQLGSATADKVEDLTDKAGKAADSVLVPVS